MAIALAASGGSDELEPALRDRALVGCLLLNEAIGHLRSISKAELRAVIVPVPEGPSDG